jgi:hypothetical protein
MAKKSLFVVFFLLFCITVYGQNSYYYSRHLTLQPQSATAQKKDLLFPVNMYNVKAVGAGNTQIANGNSFNAMTYNPAFLGRPKKSFEIIGMGASMPPNTYDAAWFMADNMDEFIEATSLTAVYDGVNAFFENGATLQQRIDALHEVQSGMQFTLDLIEEVTGPPTNPYIHGVSVIPSINAQYGSWGFSLYGFGYSGFAVAMSPTLESLSNLYIPENMDQPLLAARSMAQMLGILSSVFLGPGEGFVKEVLPMAYYMAYVDIVGAVGYGFQWKKNWLFGANLKVVNRRFSTNRVPVVDYDQIIEEALSVFDSDIWGVTGDLGCVYQSSFGTNFGLSLQNIIPIKTISKSIETSFRIPVVSYDRNQQGQIYTNAEGDTAMVSAYRIINLMRPFELKSPFIANVGIYHPLTKDWDVSLDWVDVFEQDSRYENTVGRIRFGSEYRFEPWKNKLLFSIRGGVADENFCFGLGLNITKYFQIDCAYAYDRFVNTYSYYSQIKIGW